MRPVSPGIACCCSGNGGSGYVAWDIGFPVPGLEKSNRGRSFLNDIPELSTAQANRPSSAYFPGISATTSRAVLSSLSPLNAA
jgi:hypothetical protein